jgi:Zn-dependent protease
MEPRRQWPQHPGEGTEPEREPDPGWQNPPSVGRPPAGSGHSDFQHGSDIRADDPIHRAAPPQASSRGLLGWLATVGLMIFGYAKYALLLVKVPFLLTGLTALVSFAAYAVVFGLWFGVGLVLMIFVHEMGHVLEIRRQGLKATAPVFIPFLGAAIFQRNMPPDALKQAQIAIAGPLLGTVGATAAFALFGFTHWPQWLFFAYLGFYLNLFNMLPLGFLDGGWIMGAVSKWFQLVGAAILGILVLFMHFLISPLLLIVVVLMIPTIISRFRNDSLPYYQVVPAGAKIGMGIAWLALSLYLGFAMVQSQLLLEAGHILR